MSNKKIYIAPDIREICVDKMIIMQFRSPVNDGDEDNWLGYGNSTPSQASRSVFPNDKIAADGIVSQPLSKNTPF